MQVIAMPLLSQPYIDTPWKRNVTGETTSWIYEGMETQECANHTQNQGCPSSTE